MKGLTKRQREIIDYIQEFITNNRYSPSYREIGHHFKFNSLGTVYKHVDALKRKGMLLNKNKASRSIAPTEQIVKPQQQTEIEVPFIGNISAGIPIQTFSQTKQLSVPRGLIHAPEKTYALRVQGNSLSEEMIADGDLLLVEARQEAHPGETVVALINGHDTIIKKYYEESPYVRLLSSYAVHHPIILHAENVVVQGVVVGLLRLFG